jgi:transcriptional regulator with XRE-family HTH domain
MIEKNIRIQRLIKGYSQDYMAYNLNISQNAYSKIERGQTEITLKRLYEIVKILDVPLYEILPHIAVAKSA